MFSSKRAYVRIKAPASGYAHHRLTPSACDEIRRMVLVDGKKQKDVAVMYGISTVVTSLIVNRKYKPEIRVLDKANRLVSYTWSATGGK